MVLVYECVLMFFFLRMLFVYMCVHVCCTCLFAHVCACVLLALRVWILMPCLYMCVCTRSSIHHACSYDHEASESKATFGITLDGLQTGHAFVVTQLTERLQGFKVTERC